MDRRDFISGALDAAALGSFSSSCKRASSTLPRIAVIPKGTTHEFWKAVHAGAAKSAHDSGVEIIWKGPLKEDDLKQQTDLVQSFVDRGVAGIVLAPLSDKGLANPVKEATSKKIPVVIFDSDLEGADTSSFVATDNYAAGTIAATAMASALGGKGNVVVLRYQEGSASTSNRERGFLDGIKSATGVTVVSASQYGGATTESAFATSESLLGAQRAADGNVQGIFTPNESTTFGMLRAIRAAQLGGKMKLFGFDSSEKLLEALRTGDVEGLVVQNPFKMGELAVATMAQVIRGAAVEKRIDTGATLVTKANVESAEIATLLHPDLKLWLGE
jgi:ribose transport system substrate-binding protein